MLYDMFSIILNMKRDDYMDIKKYEVLLAVIDKGSFIKAASDLGYTQSGITYMMNSLEKRMRIPITTTQQQRRRFNA